jgi:predicted DsbA family dithiol-disulfide isomerase
MRIEIYSDVVCPWCYIGERRLGRALAQRPDLEVERVWRPFQLQPELPASGLPWAAFAAAKFGGAERAWEMFARVTEIAADEGLEYRFDRMATAANTVDAHRLILFARDSGKEWPMAEALFAAYLTHGADLNDLDQLVSLAAGVGLPAEDVRAYLAGDAGRDAVAASQDEAAALGIGGVPFYVFDGRYAVSGAQPVELFLRALDLAAEGQKAS